MKTQEMKMNSKEKEDNTKMEKKEKGREIRNEIK
jgi:hypothetical protein